MPPPTTSKRKSLAELKTIEEMEPVTPKNIVITGQPGSGKTTLAATVFSPEVAKRTAMTPEELAKQEVHELKGAVWVKSDAQALVSLKMLRLIPEFVLDFAVLLDERKGDYVSAIRDLHAYLTEAKEAGAWGMVLDTATSYGHKLQRGFVAGASNGQQAWGLVGGEYIKLFETCSSLKLRQFWLAQPSVSKAMQASLVEASKKDSDDAKIQLEKARALATSVGEGSYIVPALSGNMVMDMINAQPSLSGWIRKKEKQGKMVREWMPFGTKDAPGKNRYEKHVDKIEPADLWAMDRKIEAAAGQGGGE
jgi:hypothetical protein